jgi:hypothetical protein
MTAMDGLSGSAPGQDRIQVTRSVTVGGQEFRLHLEHVNDTTVAVDLLVGCDDQPGGHLRGELQVSDVVPASQVLASLLGGLAVVQGHTGVPARTRIAQIRRTHPNAYAPWNRTDDTKLIERYREGASIAELANEFGRKPSAIGRRLERLLPSEPQRDGDGLHPLTPGT